MIDRLDAQLREAAAKAGLEKLFGPLTLDRGDVASLEAYDEVDETEVRFANADGPLGVLVIDVPEGGDPHDAGFKVRLREWRLNDDVAGSDTQRGEEAIARARMQMPQYSDEEPTAEHLWKSHTETCEPLSEEEVAIVVAAGLAKADEWDDRGGGLYWHAPTWPDVDAG